MIKEANEFRLIRDFFTGKQKPAEGLIQGIGDDCAIIQAPPTTQQAVSVDTSIAGTHFPRDANPYAIGSRALNVALSDLAAMGAKPRHFTLAMSIPSLDASWLGEFSSGLFNAANKHDVCLIGGDTTRTQNQQTMQFSVTVFGELPQGCALYRSGAKISDYIYVSGMLGDAALGLAAYFERRPITRQDKARLIDAYLDPQPEINIGLQLRLLKVASSCIDISDGLLQDLGHILNASSVGAEIGLQQIPLSSALLRNCSPKEALQLALTGGDDYKLCFTSRLPPNNFPIDNMHCIGRITDTQSLCFTGNNIGLNFESLLGFDHFHDETLQS